MGNFQVEMIAGMLLFALGIAVGCSSRKWNRQRTQSRSREPVRFVAPLVRKWSEKYHKEHPNVVVDYDIVGSGEGTNGYWKAPSISGPAMPRSPTKRSPPSNAGRFWFP